MACGAARELRRNRAAAEFVEFAGYLPDHHVITGFRVTPVVGFVNPDYQLRIAAAEVHDVFEVPLDFILDAANHKSRRRKLGDVDIEVHDIPYGERNIWGATAGMLMTLRRMLQARGGRRAMTGEISDGNSRMRELLAHHGAPARRGRLPLGSGAILREHRAVHHRRGLRSRGCHRTRRHARI